MWPFDTTRLFREVLLQIHLEEKPGGEFSEVILNRSMTLSIEYLKT